MYNWYKPRHFDCVTASVGPFRCRASKPGADKFNQLLDVEAVREHDSLGATLWPQLAKSSSERRRSGLGPR
jgi:hypothetical protein